MPAVSQQQQKLFGLALAVKRGEVARSEASDEVLNIVDSMSEKDIEDFASTSHEGLPKQVEARLRETLRELMREMAIQEAELPAAPIPSGIKTKLVQAIEKIKDTNLNYNQKLQVIGRVIDSLGVDKKELAKMSSKLKTTLESINEADPCWKGYQQIGMKKKNGKEVPNCVPESVNESLSKKDIEKLTSYNDLSKFIKANKSKINSKDFNYIEDEVEALKYLESDYKRGKADRQEVEVALIDAQDSIKRGMGIKESVNEGSHGMATKLLQSIINGDSSRAEGIKMTKELAQHFMNWVKTSPFGKKYSNLPLDMLIKASFNWGIERGLDSKLKGELSKLKSTIKESVNEGLYFVGYNKGRGQGTGVFKDSYSSYKDAKKAVEKLEKERGGSYNMVAYYVADKDGKFVRESVNEAVDIKDGKYRFYSKDGVGYLTYGGKELASGDFDWEDGSNSYWMSHSSFKGSQKAFDTGKDVINYFKSKKITTESINEGKKRFNQKNNVGSSKYVISYHDGQKKHKDGSDFFDIQIFRNQKDLETFKKALLSKGFVEESVNEAVPTQTKWAVAIASLTTTRPDAVQKFIDDNNLNSEKLYSYLKKGKLSDKMDFVTALVGKPGNPIQKKMIKMFAESVNEDANMNKKVKAFLDKELKDLSKGKPNHQFAVMHILMGALTDANFHSDAKKVPSIFPRAKYEGDPQGKQDLIDMYEYEIGPKIANICKWDGKDIVMAIGFYVSMTIGRPVGEKVEKLVESINEVFSDNKNLNYIMKGRKVTNVAYDSDFGFAVILDNGKYVLFNTHSARPGQSKDMEFESVVTEEKYKLAVEKFNNELIKHPMVKKAAQFYKKTPADIVKVLQQRLYTKGDKGGETKEVWIDFKDTTSGIEIKHKMKFNESNESHDCGCGCGGVTEGGCGTTIKEDFKSVVGKTVFSDGKGKAFFGYYKEDDSAYFVDYKTWAKLDMKDVSKGDTNKDKVVNAILRNQKQFNKKVDYNMWAKKTNPSFEQKMDYFMKNGFVSNITKAGIKVD